jgi:predicted site-specific integrase-resolvase
MYVSVSKASEITGLHPNTLRRKAKEGEIPCKVLKSGHRRFDVSDYMSKPERQTIVYCRVSSQKQKDDLERQVEYMQRIYSGAEIIKDIGSGINFKRKGLTTILERSLSGDVIELVVAHRDRLARFGVDLIK